MSLDATCAFLCLHWHLLLDARKRNVTQRERIWTMLRSISTQAFPPYALGVPNSQELLSTCHSLCSEEKQKFQNMDMLSQDLHVDGQICAVGYGQSTSHVD